MNVYRFLIGLLLAGTLFRTAPVQARLRHPATGEKVPVVANRGLDFVENKGQWNQQARFKAQIAGGVFFLTDEAMVYNFADMEEWHRVYDTVPERRPTSLHQHAYKVHFAGCNNNAMYLREEKRSYYHNYFKGRDTSRWKGHVGVSGRIVRKQLYQGIDLAVYSKDNRLKYDFLVSAGADAGQISLVYEGVQPEITAEGHLRIQTSVNEITEQAPYCYQVVNGEKQIIPSAYRLQGNTLTIVFPEGYHTQLPLVIDPELVFASYSGAQVPAGAALLRPIGVHATTYDALGRLYAAINIAEAGWPVTTGAFQTTNADFDDVAINVYNATGSSLVYATYFGGELQEHPLSMIVNPQGELILAGSTNSEDDFPVTPGCFDASFNGPGPVGLVPSPSGDIFIAHFNATGSALLGATYLGGTASELIPSSNNMNTMFAEHLPGYVDVVMCPLELTLDPQGNIWLIANTASTDFPVTANAQQPAFAGGITDAVLCKISPDCSQLLYSSFLGGSLGDIGYGIQRNVNGNLVICGGTQSTNFPVTPGALHTVAPGGGFDGFVCVINPANGMILQSTYMGTSGKDQTTLIQLDPAGNIYTAGVSYGNYPVSPGAYALPQGLIFLDKLNSNLTSSLVSTRLGLSLLSRPVGMAFTSCKQLLIGTYSALPPNSNTMPVTQNALATIPRRFWFATLTEDFSTLSYASYFGSDMTTQVNGLMPSDIFLTGIHRYDPRGTLYQSVTTSNAGFPTTPGCFMPTSPLVGFPPMSQQLDLGVFKINFGISSNFSLVNGNDSGCAPYTVQFENNASGASTYTWDFGDGSAQSNLATPPPHTYTIPGTYTVTLIVTNDSTCTKADTAFTDITVLTVTQPDISLQDTILCNPLQAMNIGVQINNPNPNFAIAWGPANALLSPSNQQNITVNPFLSNIFYVTVTDDAGGICTATASDTMHIDMAPVNLDILTPDTTVCQGTTLPISATGNPNYSFRWIPGTGMNDSTILEPVITVNEPEVYVLTATYPGCPDTSLLLSIGMEITPQVALGPDKIVCQWVPVALESLITPFNNSYLFQWTPATPNLSSPNEPNTYFPADSSVGYTLTVQTPFGCTGKDSIYVTVIPGGFGGITADTGYCPGDSVLLQATGGSTYSWTPAYGLNDTTIAGPVAIPPTTASYTVYITNQYGCVDTERVNIQVYPNAVLAIPDSITVYPGEQYHLEPGTNCLYFSWFPPSGISGTQLSDPLFNPEVRTRYFVTATTEHGCSVRDSIDVLVKETVMDIPNAFAPSGTNSLFRPSIRGIAQLKEFSIFNRWGNKVYSSRNIQEGWDGTYNGKPQPIGVYVYYIDAVTDSGRPFQRRGNVTLIR